MFYLIHYGIGMCAIMAMVMVYRYLINCQILNYEIFLNYRYVPMARSTVTNVSLNQCIEKVKNKIKDIITDKDSISLTADIWSDRIMRSFLGVTAHMCVLEPKSGAEELRSFLLSCQRFSGSHTGTRIAAAFDDILETYDLNNKVE